MVKHTQTIRRLLPTNCLSVLDHFVGLAPKVFNPLCSCSLETESTADFFLRCRNYTNICITPTNELNDIDNSVTTRQPNELIPIILYEDCQFKYNDGKQILIATIQFIKNSNRFNQSLI